MMKFHAEPSARRIAFIYVAVVVVMHLEIVDRNEIGPLRHKETWYVVVPQIVVMLAAFFAETRVVPFVIVAAYALSWFVLFGGHYDLFVSARETQRLNAFVIYEKFCPLRQSNVRTLQLQLGGQDLVHTNGANRKNQTEFSQWWTEQGLPGRIPNGTEGYPHIWAGTYLLAKRACLESHEWILVLEEDARFHSAYGIANDVAAVPKEYDVTFIDARMYRDSWFKTKYLASNTVSMLYRRSVLCDFIVPNVMLPQLRSGKFNEVFSQVLWQETCKRFQCGIAPFICEIGDFSLHA